MENIIEDNTTSKTQYRPLTKNLKRNNYIEFKKFYVPFVKIFIPCLAYALLRYTVNHEEPWQDIPFYLMNKVLGVSSVIIMSLAYVIGPLAKFSSRFKKYISYRKYYGIGGFFLGCAHGMMSLLLMTPNNYKVFYNLDTGRLNFQGSLSMLFGTLAIFHLCFIAITSLPPLIKTMHSKQWKEIQRSGMSIVLILSYRYLLMYQNSKKSHLISQKSISNTKN